MIKKEDFIVTDKLNRKLHIKHLSVLETVRMQRAIGPDQSLNAPYTNMVRLALSVREIDGIPIMFPRNEEGIDAVISKVGDEGYEAVVNYYVEEKLKADKDKAELLRNYAPFKADENKEADNPLEESKQS